MNNYLNKTIAIICYSRIDFLDEVFSAILSARNAKYYDLVVFCDAPKDDSIKCLTDKVADYINQYSFYKIFNSFKLNISDINLGVWNSKLNAFEKSFEYGADAVLLIEDDVVISNDALCFFDIASEFSLSLPELSTISLYSTNFEVTHGITYINAIKFLESSPSINEKWGARIWPFPWGSGLTKNNFNLLRSLGWNGNDQEMGRLLVENNGVDFFPILTRAKHIGDYSSVQNKKIDIKTHFNYIFDDSQTTFSNADLRIEDLIKTADNYYLKLMNDQKIADNQIQIFYTNENELAKARLKYGEGFHRIEKKIDLNSFDMDKGVTDKILSRLFCTNIAISVDDKVVRNYIAERINSNIFNIIFID